MPLHVGGSPVASQKLHHEILEVRKPVVVSMGNLAASAAYHIAGKPSTCRRLAVLLSCCCMEKLFEVLMICLTTTVR